MTEEKLLTDKQWRAMHGWDNAQAELKEKQLLVNANKMMNERLGKALEVAEAFLRGRSGTVKVLKQIQRLKEGGD